MLSSTSIVLSADLLMKKGLFYQTINQISCDELKKISGTAKRQKQNKVQIMFTHGCRNYFFHLALLVISSGNFAQFVLKIGENFCSINASRNEYFEEENRSTLQIQRQSYLLTLYPVMLLMYMGMNKIFVGLCVI